MGKTVAEIVTETIIEKLKEGTAPWHRPWITKQAVNWETQRPYRGINRWLLEGGEYVTFGQIKKFGGKIKNGARSFIVVFYTPYDKKDEDDETADEKKKRKGSVLRYYRVWEISDVENIESKRKDTEKPPVFTEEGCENVLNTYFNKYGIPFKHTNKNEAYYNPTKDYVNVPPIEGFDSTAHYYSTAFHEGVHSTGHESRLDRPLLNGYGTKEYAREELVAEIGSAMLSQIMGISTEEIMDNSAAYLNSWLSALEQDTNLILYASAKAEKAVEMIRGESGENDA